MKQEKKWFTGDFINCCLKLAKDIESFCMCDLIEKLKEGYNKLLYLV